MNRFNKFALLCVTGSVLAVSSATAAFAEQVSGTVYQIEPGAVYVEAADHTAVKVPTDGATFTTRGMPTTVASLHIGNPVEAQYTPDSMMEPYKIIYVAPSNTERVYIREFKDDDGRLVRTYREEGRTVRYVWFNGRWHRDLGPVAK